METEDHLYITLPSSASMDLHPGNTISDYTTEMLSPINLEREMYEAGLSEIILDTRIENISKEHLVFTIHRSVDFVKNTLKNINIKRLRTVKINGVEYYLESFFIKRGMYNSLSDMCRFFNNKFMASYMCQDLVFRNNKPEGETLEIVTLKSFRSMNLRELKNFYFQPSPWFRKCITVTDHPSAGASRPNPSTKAFVSLLLRHLPSVMDFPVTLDNAYTKSIHFICDPNELMQHPGMAYVYTDIVDHQYVGNTKASLLRVVNFPENDRVITFPNVHYLPVCKAKLNSIRIYIRDVEGRSYPFVQGSAVCKVHIRKKFR